MNKENTLAKDFERALEFIEGCSLVAPEILESVMGVSKKRAKQIMAMYHMDGLLEKNEKDGYWYYYYRHNFGMKDKAREVEKEAQDIYRQKHRYDWLKFWKRNPFPEKGMWSCYEIWEIPEIQP